MRIASGTVDQYIYFVAVDSTDRVTRETGLTGFTVYRSRNGGTAAAMTTPTINETDATNMPGVYELLLDEDMTIDSGDAEQEMVFHITQASMAPVTVAITLFETPATAANLATVDGIVDNILTDTGTTLPASIAAAQTDLDTITDTGVVATNMRGTDNAALATSLTTVEGKIDTVDGIVDAILVDTGTTLPARLTGIEGATFATGTDSLEAIRNRGDAAWTTGAGGGGSLSGAFTITVTVTDGTTPLENATVRVTNGVDTDALSTDASGNATFSLDAATWTVSITKSGYTFTPLTRTVTGNEAGTLVSDLEMTLVSPSASNAGFSTGYTYVYDEAGAVESGVTVTYYYTAAPTGSGLVLDTKMRSGTTDANGYVEFTNMIQGARFQFKRGVGSYTSQVVPATATFELTNAVGADA